MTYDQQHIANISAYAQKLEKSFDKVISKISALADDPNARFSRSFVFRDNKALSKASDAIFKPFQAEVENIISGGILEEWSLSNKKNDALVNSFVNNLEVLKKKPDWTSHNLKALQAFTDRQTNGIDLSKRIWDIVGQTQAEMEIQLGFGIINGDSADVISRRIRENLNEPDVLFRRIRNDIGELEWSKAAKAYNPGQGKYRSAYKNARRLTVTETNMAYRSADQLRWDKLGFVLGYQVVLSGSHPALDICDDFKGEYPKSFVFTGWHPQCLCHAIPILMTANQYDKYENAILDGTDENYLERIKHIDSVPEGFTNWINNNAERVAGWKSAPYFIKDNFIDGDVSKRLNIWPRPLLTDIKTFENGGVFSTYSNIDKNSNDYKAVSFCCEEFANQGNQTIILPKLNYKDPAYPIIFKELLDTQYAGKCPDFKLNDLFYEHEGFITNNPKSNFSNMLNRGLKQSDNVVIDECGLSYHYMRRIINARIREGVNINEIWIKKKNSLDLFYKKTEAKQ